MQDCGKTICSRAIRCHICNLKNNNPMFKQEFIDKVQESRKGYKPSEETKEKQSQARKEYMKNISNKDYILMCERNKKAPKFPHGHHIDLNKDNNEPSNKLILSNSNHQKLHRLSYNYLVEIGLIESYVNWFYKKFNLEKIHEKTISQ